MDAELKALEEKLAQLLQLCQRLRAENNKLRQDLAASANNNQHLAEKVQTAAARLETLIARMPETE